MTNTPKRRGNPNWVKGVSGNPGGRPKDAEKIRELALSKSPEHIENLDQIALDPKQPGRTRVEASKALLERGLGRPAVIVDDNGERLEIVVRTPAGHSPFVMPDEEQEEERKGGNGPVS